MIPDASSIQKDGTAKGLKVRNPRNYSAFNAITGSTRVARRPGTALATNATEVSSTLTSANVAGSPAVAQDEAHHIGALRAKRHANSNLLRPLGDTVGNHTVDTDRRENQRRSRKHRQ